MLAQSKLAEQYHIQVTVIVSLLVEDLAFVQVDDLAEVENRLDNIQVELAEDRMVVVETEMAHVDLDLITGSLSLSKLLSDLKEALFDLSFNTGFQLLLHIVELKVLSFEVLKREALLFGVTRLHILHDRLISIFSSICQLILSHCLEHAIVITHSAVASSVLILDRTIELACRRRRSHRHTSLH